MQKNGKGSRKNSTDLNPAAVNELESMRGDINPMSQGIFQSITQDEIRRQAYVLVKNVTPDFINGIVDESGMNPADARQVKDLLIGRRNILIQLFGIPQ